MWNILGNRDERTDRERYLEDELEEMRRRERDQFEQRERERAERMREYQERADENMRSASSWVEALAKQEMLFQREANRWDIDDEPDVWFGPGAEACRRALVIWQDEEDGVSEEMDELYRRIDELRDTIRKNVAARLRAEDDRTGWQHVANAIENEDFNEWLWW